MSGIENTAVQPSTHIPQAVGAAYAEQARGTKNVCLVSFGDGGTSTEQNPTHTYTTAGTYFVRLGVTGPGGVVVLTKLDYITVGEPAPVVDFTAIPTGGVLPLKSGDQASADFGVLGTVGLTVA